jgi:hypothetical protein
MTAQNVMILTSDLGTVSLTTSDVDSLVALAGEFLDRHDSWAVQCDIVIVHRNQTVLRRRFDSVTEVITFIRGYVACLWLLSDTIQMPNMNWVDWQNKSGLKVAFDAYAQARKEALEKHD